MQPWVYIVLLGVFAIAYALMLPARTQQKQAEMQSLKDTEAALELYMTDMERENEELIKLVSGIKQQAVANQEALQEQITALETLFAEQQLRTAQLESRVDNAETGLLQQAFTYKEISSEGKELESKEQLTLESVVPEPQPKPVSSIKLRYPKLFELDEQGKSIDTIAKTAGLQRGEVQLILQLAKQEESV